MQKIYNEDCFDTMKRLGEKSINIVLTSPFYNTNKKAGKNGTIENTTLKNNAYPYIRYDKHVDNMTNEEYENFTINLFNSFDRIVAKDGCILYNISYSADNPANLFTLVSNITLKTSWTVADVICWKKRTAFPNSTSSNRLTRIFEFVFVFCRKEEDHTFYMNKKCTSLRETGQKAYENIYNFIEAKNNDESCPYNKATYSTDLCLQLLSIYANPNDKNFTVYDPFMGSGTTAVACKQMGINCYGSEISENQVKWAENRLKNTQTSLFI